MSDEQTDPGPSPCCPWCGTYSGILENLVEAEPDDDIRIPPPTAHLVCGVCAGVSFLTVTMRPATEAEVASGGRALADLRARVTENPTPTPDTKESTAP